jgi:hypothetical protein
MSISQHTMQSASRSDRPTTKSKDQNDSMHSEISRFDRPTTKAKDQNDSNHSEIVGTVIRSRCRTTLKIEHYALVMPILLVAQITFPYADKIEIAIRGGAVCTARMRVKSLEKGWEMVAESGCQGSREQALEDLAKKVEGLRKVF